MIDTVGAQDNSSLRALIDKPPIGGKEILPLSGPGLAGFKLHPGSVSDQCVCFKDIHNSLTESSYFKICQEMVIVTMGKLEPCTFVKQQKYFLISGLPAKPILTYKNLHF